MSMTLPSAPVHAAAPAARRRSLPNWLREPLLHFVVLGTLLCAVDHFLVSKADDPNTIVVGTEVTDEAKRLFRESRGREPSAEELQALSRRWLDNEVLYREGMALGVDRGDKMIRDRVIFKSLMVIETGLKLPPVDDKMLREWFEAQRSRYDEPARYDFQEAVLSAGASEAAARAFADALNAGTPGDAQAGLRVFKGRPLETLTQSYGTDFARALAESTVGQWSVLPTRDGPRVMRLEAIVAPQPASFDALRNAVLADWTDATMAQLRTDAVRARSQKYTIRFEGAAS